MRIFGSILTNLSIVALLALQVSGTHLHAESKSHVGDEYHGIHVEQEMSAKHKLSDHADHVDISLDDIPVKLKADPVLLSSHINLVPQISTVVTRWFVPLSTAPPAKLVRLTPPQRAPPELV